MYVQSLQENFQWRALRQTPVSIDTLMHGAPAKRLEGPTCVKAAGLSSVATPARPQLLNPCPDQDTHTHAHTHARTHTHTPF